MQRDKLTHLVLSIFITLAMTACGEGTVTNAQDDAGTEQADTDTTDTTDTGDTTDTSAQDELAITGDYVDSWGSEHSITQETWTTDGSSLFHITYLSNDEQVIIAQNDEANEYNPELWSRFDWTETDEGLWYCQSAYDAATEEDAMATEAADATNPADSGCGGFGWTKLDAAPSN